MVHSPVFGPIDRLGSPRELFPIGGRENTVGSADVICLVDITIFENEGQVLVDGLIAEAGLERKSSEGAEPVGNDPVVGEWSVRFIRF